MKGALGLRNPIASYYINTSSTSITSSAYVQLAAATTKGASAIMISSQCAFPLKIAIGSSGHEVDTNLLIPPTMQNYGPIPIEIPSGSRISLETVGGAVSSGILTCTLFG